MITSAVTADVHSRSKTPRSGMVDCPLCNIRKRPLGATLSQQSEDNETLSEVQVIQAMS